MKVYGASGTLSANVPVAVTVTSVVPVSADFTLTAVAGHGDDGARWDRAGDVEQRRNQWL